MIPNTDLQSNTFVTSYINLPSFLQLWFYQTFSECVKSSSFTFLLHFLQPKLHHQESIQIQNGRCLTTLKLSKAPLGIAFLSVVLHLSLELLNPLPSKGPSSLLVLHTEAGKAGQPDEKKGGRGQVTGSRKKWWLREDGWLQESKATGGQVVPLLVEACWRTGHDAACEHVCVCVCVFVCVCETLSVSIKTHLLVQDKRWAEGEKQGNPESSRSSLSGICNS